MRLLLLVSAAVCSAAVGSAAVLTGRVGGPEVAEAVVLLQQDGVVHDVEVPVLANAFRHHVPAGNYTLVFSSLGFRFEPARWRVEVPAAALPDDPAHVAVFAPGTTPEPQAGDVVVTAVPRTYVVAPLDSSVLALLSQNKLMIGGVAFAVFSLVGPSFMEKMFPEYAAEYKQMKEDAMQKAKKQA